MLSLSQIIFKDFFVSEIEHFVSPVPIKCDLELQKDEILTENFDPEDKTQGSDTSRIWVNIDNMFDL